MLFSGIFTILSSKITLNMTDKIKTIGLEESLQVLEFELTSVFVEVQKISRNFSILSIEASAIFSHNVRHQMHQNIFPLNMIQITQIHRIFVYKPILTRCKICFPGMDLSQDLLIL